MRRFVQALSGGDSIDPVVPAGVREALAGFPDRYNIAIRNPAAIVFIQDARWKVAPMSWGLVPSWSRPIAIPGASFRGCDASAWRAAVRGFRRAHRTAKHAGSAPPRRRGRHRTSRLPDAGDARRRSGCGRTARSLAARRAGPDVRRAESKARARGRRTARVRRRVRRRPRARCWLRSPAPKRAPDGARRRGRRGCVAVRVRWRS